MEGFFVTFTYTSVVCDDITTVRKDVAYKKTIERIQNI